MKIIKMRDEKKKKKRKQDDGRCLFRVGLGGWEGGRWRVCGRMVNYSLLASK